MITSGKSDKMLSALKDYKKRYLNKSMIDLDESGTRIMINTFLTSILGYQELEEIKTEYMIKGTYADYIVQIGGKRYLLVEVKAFGLELSDKHLRQAVGYGANEGIDWCILTNGRQFRFYKIIVEKQVTERLVLEIDFTAEDFNVKDALENLIYFHRDAVVKKSLVALWSRTNALDPAGIAGLLYSPQIIAIIKKELKNKYDAKFEDDEIMNSISEIISCELDLDTIKIPRFKSKKAVKKVVTGNDAPAASEPVQEATA